MGDMPNILQIENLLDLVEYALKESSEKEFMVLNSVSTMNTLMNNSLLEISVDFLHQLKIVFFHTNHSQSRVV